MESLNQWHELMLETMELAQHHQAAQHEKQQQQAQQQQQQQQVATGRRSLATTCLASSLLPVSHKASHPSNNNNNTNNNKRLQRQQAFANPLAAGPKLFQTQSSSSSSWSHCTGTSGSEKADATATAEPLEHKEPPFCARTPHATHSSTVALDPATTTTTPKKDKEKEDDTCATPHVHVHPDETQPADQPSEDDELQGSLLFSPEPRQDDEEDDSVLDKSFSPVDGTKVNGRDTPETMAAIESADTSMEASDPVPNAAAISSSLVVWSDSVRDVLDSVVSEALNGQDNDAAFSSSLSHPTPKLPGSPGGGSDTSSTSSGIGPLMQLTTSSSSSNSSTSGMERPEQQDEEEQEDPKELGPTVADTTRTTGNDDLDAALPPSTEHSHRLVSV